MKNFIWIFILFLAASCGDLHELNENVKDPASVSGESLFTGAQKSLADQMVTLNVNNNNTKLYAQYITQTTYTDESNYDLIGRSVPEEHWSVMYNDVIKDLTEAAIIISSSTYVSPEDGYTENKLAIIEVLTVFAYSNLVETFGNVPYSEALDDSILEPAYDDGLVVYRDLISRLNAAIAKLDQSQGSFSIDNIYGGDVSLWYKFANSLKLRMGLLLADVTSEATLVSETVRNAATEVFQSNADNANFHYLGAQPNTNPINVDLVASGRKDFVACATFLDVLKSLDDPRMSKFYEDKFEVVVDTNTNETELQYLGGTIGASNNYSNFSHVNSNLSVVDAPGTIFSYDEVQFLLAEAAERGLVTTTAEEHYNEGVTASIMAWGGSMEDAEDYLANPAVNYATADGNWKAKIATQSWVALFNRGMEAWTMIRKFDVDLPTPADAFSGFPMRYTYPIVEQTLNGANWEKASTTIGGDMVETKLFWDN